MNRINVTIVVQLIVRLLGRQLAWRIGRALYRAARLESPNSPEANGEIILQRALLQSYAKAPRTRSFVAFDVGANVGDWSWLFLDNALREGVSEIELHAFEPVPRTHLVLQRRMESHSCHAVVRTIQAGLSRETKDGIMFEFAELAGVNSLHRDPLQRDGATLNVRLISAEDYCSAAQVDFIDLLKCDAEGHDMEILHGAAALLRSESISVIQFEYNHRWLFSRHCLKDAFDLVNSLPYRVGKLTPQGVELYDAWHPELDRFFEGNYVLVHERMIDSLPTWRGRFDNFNTFVVQR
jgi:FkbM family methyltransferase